MQAETTRYPFINLSKALEKAEVLYKADPRRNFMQIATVFEEWGYSLKSSGGHQTVAALIMYGLVEDEGSREGRRLRLTEDAFRYFRDERDDKKVEYLRGFALKPKLLHALWNSWRGTPPADSVARSHLKLDRGLNEQSARSVLGLYKDNLKYASLIELDEVQTEELTSWQSNVTELNGDSDQDHPRRTNEFRDTVSAQEARLETNGQGPSGHKGN
jgi:hypothetical protein